MAYNLLTITDLVSPAYLMWVPVTVKDDNGVRGLQIEAQASSASAEQEDKVI